MVLINVDFPQPFGPRMAMCLLQLTRRVKSSSTILLPRITPMLCRSRRAAREVILCSLDDGAKAGNYCGARARWAAGRTMGVPTLPAVLRSGTSGDLLKVFRRLR